MSEYKHGPTNPIDVALTWAYFKRNKENSSLERLNNSKERGRVRVMLAAGAIMAGIALGSILTQPNRQIIDNSQYFSEEQKRSSDDVEAFKQAGTLHEVGNYLFYHPSNWEFVNNYFIIHGSDGKANKLWFSVNEDFPMGNFPDYAKQNYQRITENRSSVFNPSMLGKTTINGRQAYRFSYQITDNETQIIYIENDLFKAFNLTVITDKETAEANGHDIDMAVRTFQPQPNLH
ncbi:MAG: hypothetical protein Q8P92_01040 [Candidatus Daviesbacteria bacterium]|nr:hypothetical protein [Candidatus Daviesbacteria bacterium]